MAHLINWFEIPAVNIERAAQFYGKVFESPVEVTDFHGVKMGFFTGNETDEIGGAVVEHTDYTPSATDGPLVYLNGGQDLTEMLNKAKTAGAEVVQEKTLISPEIGYMALFLDSEGNRIAIHSPE
ncbi:MAG: VOC family protein [Bacteroidota bacterium]